MISLGLPILGDSYCGIGFRLVGAWAGVWLEFFIEISFLMSIGDSCSLMKWFFGLIVSRSGYRGELIGSGDGCVRVEILSDLPLKVQVGVEWKE